MRSLSSEQPGLRACLEAMRLRLCRLCGTSDDGVFGRCVERYRQVPRLLVVARGAQYEIALVPVA